MSSTLKQSQNLNFLSNQVFFDLLSNNLPIVYFAVDKESKVVHCAGPALGFMGQKPEDSIGHRVRDLLPPGHPFIAEVERALASERGFTTKHEVNGRWLQTCMSPRYNDESFSGLVAFSLDITERHEYQLERERSQDKRIKMASHDIRSLLSGVVSVLRSTREEGIASLDMSLIQSMIQNCENAIQLTEGLTEAKEFLDCPLKFEPRLIEIREYFFKLFEELQVLSRAKGKRLVLNLEFAPFSFWMDGSVMKRAITNLVNNAFVHTSKGQFIELRVKENEKQDLLISVKDEGTGLTKEMAENLLTESSKRFSESSHHGLGLFIVKNIVELHHGDLKVDSAPQQGTKFTIRLPYLPSSREKMAL